MHQADGDAVDAVAPEAFDRSGDIGLDERCQLLTSEVEATADLTDPLRRDDPFRLDPEVGVPVPVGHRLALDLENVSEAARDDQAETVEVLLQHGVRGRRRAVRDSTHVLYREAATGRDLADAFDERERRVCRR